MQLHARTGRTWLHLGLLLGFLPAEAGGPAAGGRSGAERELAPDGHRSLGADQEVSEILKLFFQPTREDEAFLAELAELEGRMRVFASTTEALYRSRGAFEVSDLEVELDLEALNHALLDVFEAPDSHLTRGGDAAGVHAALLLDARVHVRAGLFHGWKRDAREVEDGLRVLRACTDGWSTLEDEEGQLIARRVDFAGSLLRARIKDLSALRETPGARAGVPAEDVERLAAVLRMPSGVERTDLLRAELAVVERKVEAMRGVLFHTRLSTELEGWFRWRDELDSKAALLLEEVEVWRPDNDEGKDLPREIRKRTKTDRRQRTLGLAKEGLSYDPFDAELAYAAGLMAEMVSQKIEAASYFDRFLALRGIRVHDDRNWRKRELTPEEDHAIFEIQEYDNEQRGG